MQQGCGWARRYDGRVDAPLHGMPPRLCWRARLPTRACWRFGRSRRIDAYFGIDKDILPLFSIGFSRAQYEQRWRPTRHHATMPFMRRKSAFSSRRRHYLFMACLCRRVLHVPGAIAAQVSLPNFTATNEAVMHKWAIYSGSSFDSH